MTGLSVSVTSDRTVRVVVTVDTVVAAPLTVWRDELSGPLRVVPGGLELPAASTVLDDGHAALNRTLIYSMTDASGARWYAPGAVTVTSALSLLSEPISGASADVTISAWDQLAYPSRSVVVDVEGRRGRVRIHDVEGAPTTPELRLRTETPEQLQAVRAMCAPGVALLLRAACVGVEDQFLGLSGRVEQRVTSRSSDWRRHHVFSEVLMEERPDGRIRTAGDTLGDLHAAVPGTLRDIADTWATLGEIAAADLGAL